MKQSEHRRAEKLSISILCLKFLDLSAAIEPVDHSIFITRLQRLYGVDNESSDWFSHIPVIDHTDSA